MVIRRVGTSRSASNTISRHTVVATKDAVKEKQVQQTNKQTVCFVLCYIDTIDPSRKIPKGKVYGNFPLWKI